MGFFKEKEGYVDYTLLKRKGILKTSETQSNSSNDIIDFTAPSAGASVPVPIHSSPSSSTEPSNPFSFLDNVSSSSSQSQSAYPSSSDLSNSQSTPSSSELNALKIKLEDLEYKLERLMEKISLLESKNI